MFMLCPKRFGSEQSKIGSNPSWSNIFMNLRFHEIFSKFIILIYSWLKCYKISREITAEYKFKCDSINGLHPFLTRDHPYTTSAIFPDFWHPTPPCRFFSTIYRQFWPIIDPSPPLPIVDVVYGGTPMRIYGQGAFTSKTFDTPIKMG